MDFNFLRFSKTEVSAMSFFEKNTMKSHEMVSSPVALMDRLREEGLACHDEPCFSTVM